MYWITLRSLVDQVAHTHVTIDVKYLPTIVEEGVCFETMGVQCLTQYCTCGIAPKESTCGYFYADLPRTIHVKILQLVRREYNVDDIRQHIAREYRVIVPPDFLILHYKNVKNCVKIYNGLMIIVAVVHGLLATVIVDVKMYVYIFKNYILRRLLLMF